MTAILPQRASPSLPCWDFAFGDERFDCPDCEWDERHDRYDDGEGECATCDGRGSISIWTVLEQFTPEDFGVRRDEHGDIYVNKWRDA